MDILPAGDLDEGRIPAFVNNPAHYARFVRYLETYDFILVDTPPVTLFTDAVVGFLDAP